MPGCAHKLHSQQGLMQLWVRGRKCELSRHPLIFSASSASVDTSRAPGSNTAASVEPKRSRDVIWSKHRLLHLQYWHILYTISMGGIILMFTPSSHNEVRLTSNSVLESLGKADPPVPGRAAGSTEESNTETQQPHDYFFVYKRTLDTSFRKIWLTTIFFLEKKLMTNEQKSLTRRQLRCINTTLCKSCHWQICTRQSNCNCATFWLRTAFRSDTTDVLNCHRHHPDLHNPDGFGHSPRH